MANVMTPKFRVSYPKVFKAEINKLSGKEEYSLVALFPKGTDLTALKKAAAEAVAEKWGNKTPKNLKSPFRKHEERIIENDDGSKTMPNGMEEGGIFMNLKSKQRPGLIDGAKNDIISDADFYAGCYARATVRPYAYEQAGNCGVAFGLQNIQKVAEGDPLGSRTKAQDDFAPIEGAAESSGSADSLFN